MVPNTSRFLSISVAAALLAACGGGGSAGSTTSTTGTTTTPQTGTVAMMISDASSEDWASIDVNILSIALVPQGGGDNVTVYTAPAGGTMLNLAELDQIAEILGNTSVPVGTYTAALLTISANPGDVALTVAADPEAGFPIAAGTPIPADQIQIQHTQGSAPNLTVPVTVDFVAPLVVAAGENNALDLEFDLAHPAFLVGHTPPSAGGNTLWAVNFKGPVRHHPLHDLTRLVLRHMYGDVSAVASGSITIAKEFPTEPIVTPETEVTSATSLQISADATNGTIFYDMDAKTRTVIKDFSSDASLQGRQVRIAARYQEDGSLVATRIWAANDFNTVWLSPEGHVLHVNPITHVVTVATETGGSVKLTVDTNTEFFFREPYDPTVDSAPIGTGFAFLTNKDLVRGFKIHASAVDVTASPMIAQSIDIETAIYDGQISAPGQSSFTLTRSFRTATDDYVKTLNYIGNATANGADDAGTAIAGFKWWNFAYPTVLMDGGMTAINDFVAATNGSVDFGGTVGTVPSRGIGFATWNDPASPNAWAAADAILMPSLLPLGFVANSYANGTFSMTVLGGASAATVDVSTTSGSATLVYQVDCTNGIVTVSPIDVTTSSGLASLMSGLVSAAPVKVYGTAQADGTLKAYVVTYFTGQAPAQ
jgi:hypothetical protein